MKHYANVTVCANIADTLKSSHISPTASLQASACLKNIMLETKGIARVTGGFSKKSIYHLFTLYKAGKLAIWGSSSL